MPNSSARRVFVVPFDPAWAERYRSEAEELARIIGENLIAIHHIGSTAIPGIVAKPIVDMLVVVRDIARVDALDAQMIARGYDPRGENGIPERRYYVKGFQGQRSHHLHVYAEGSPQVARHLAFRDYLIAHSEQARAYSDLKVALAARFPEDARMYSEGKAEFIRDVERRALEWAVRRHDPSQSPSR